MCEIFNFKMSHKFFHLIFYFSICIDCAQDKLYYPNLGRAKTKVHTICWQVIKFFIICFRCCKHMFEIRSANTYFYYIWVCVCVWVEWITKISKIKCLHSKMYFYGMFSNMPLFEDIFPLLLVYVLILH